MGQGVNTEDGNVSGQLALAFLVGSARASSSAEAINKGIYKRIRFVRNMFISVIYAILLGFLGFYALFDFHQVQPWGRRPRSGGHDAHAPQRHHRAGRLKAEPMRSRP
jgi:hypothetical protein